MIYVYACAAIFGLFLSRFVVYHKNQTGGWKARTLAEIQKRGYVPSEWFLAYDERPQPLTRKPYKPVLALWRSFARFFWWRPRNYLYDLYWATHGRIKVGFPYVEAWNADYYIARYAAPRVRYMLEKGVLSYPVGTEANEWKYTLGEIAWALEFAAYDDNEFCDDWCWIRCTNGLRLFGEHFFSLWD